MAKKLETEKPAYGDAQVLAQAQQTADDGTPVMPPGPMAQAVQQAIAQGEAQGTANQGEVPANAPKTPVRQQAQAQADQPFSPPQGILSAPAVVPLRQPVRTRFERDQEVAMMWGTVADDRGTALTQMIRSQLNGVD